MKYLKLLVVAAAAATALFAVVGAGAAAAETVLCTQSADPCPIAKTDGTGTEIKASLVSGTKSTITTFKAIECGKASFTAKVTGTGKTIGASVEALSFEECNCEVKVLGKGTLELERIAKSSDATTKSTGTETTASCSTIFGNVHCIYKTGATDLGTLEGGNPAKLKVSVDLPLLTTSVLCEAAEGPNALWEAEYEVSSPKPLFVEPEERAPETVLCTEEALACPIAKADGEGTEIKASLVSGTKSKITAGVAGVNVECGKSSLTAKVTSTGKAIGASVEGLSFEECNCEVKVLGKGTLELKRIAGSSATAKSTGTEVTASCSTIFGKVHCIYKTEATDLGTLEGGNPAELKVSVELPRLETSGLCNETALWEAEYEVSSPKPLYVEPE